MKRIITFFIVLTALLVSTQVEAQKKYAFGSRTGETLTSAVAVSVTPAATLTVYTVSADTNITWSVDNSYAVIGDRLVLAISADASNRVMTFGTNITATTDSVLANKTKLFEYIYTGSTYHCLGKLQAD